MLGARRFEDEIALCGAPIEDHGAGGGTDWQYVAGGAAYGIPYRALLPRNARRAARRRPLLLVDARRTRVSARSMATCMAMGQAAGTAAALAVGRQLPAARPSGRYIALPTNRQRSDPRAMSDPNELRNGLVANAVREHRLVVDPAPRRAAVRPCSRSSTSSPMPACASSRSPSTRPRRHEICARCASGSTRATTARSSWGPGRCCAAQQLDDGDRCRRPILRVACARARSPASFARGGRAVQPRRA